jgi:3-deoxy-D-manno-octulosonate 8-phosphate phosphatase (KDO 8-P phosphatase)
MQDLYNFVSRKIWQNYQPDMDNFKEKLKDIKAFAFDVDGVFSDLITLDTQGELLRSMNVKDGYAVAEAVKAGLKIAIITGGDSQSVRIRFNRLGVPDVYLASKSKLTDLNDFCTKQNIALSEVLYMGDDVPDYECMKHVGLATCPADACPEIIGVSHYISDKRGSEGCVRDVIEQVMRVQGTWFKPF